MTRTALLRRIPAGPAFGAAVLAVAVLSLGVALLGRGPRSDAAPDMVAVTLDHPIWVQRHEVTVAEWNRCAAAGGCDRSLPVPPGRQAETVPATGINHPEASQYVAWVSAETRHPYRLPGGAEWSALARDVVEQTADPLFSQPELDWASAYVTDARKTRALRPSGAFSVSPQGVADLDGSVWEWTSDCYAGSAGQTADDRCAAFLVGGEHLAVIPWLERDPARGGCAVGTPPAHLGVRLVTDTDPGTGL